MIKQVALLIFGWRRTPERFVSKCSGYIAAYLNDRDSIHRGKITDACSLSLSRLAYTRARKESDREPRFIQFLRELDKVGEAVEAALSGLEIGDREVRGIMAWHVVDCGEARVEAQCLDERHRLQAEDEREVSQRNTDGPSFTRIVIALVLGFAILAALTSVIAVFRR